MAAGADSVLLDEVGEEWPLVRFLLDDPVYASVYESELEFVLEGPFEIEKVHARIERYHELLAPYVVGPEGEQAPYSFVRSPTAFEGSLVGGPDALMPHVVARHQAVREALGQ